MKFEIKFGEKNKIVIEAEIEMPDARPSGEPDEPQADAWQRIQALLPLMLYQAVYGRDDVLSA